MDYILVIAALYNLVGAFIIWFKASAVENTRIEGSHLEGTSLNNTPNLMLPEYMQFRIFTGGTAFLFALIYLYIFYVPDLAIPLLVFGIALKFWSFISTFICYKKYDFPKEEFIKIGIGNLLFAVLFVFYLLSLTSS